MHRFTILNMIYTKYIVLFINAWDIHFMSSEKHYTVRVILIDLPPDVPYISGSAYNSHKVKDHQIDMREDSVVLQTSSQELQSLCDPVFSGSWLKVLLPERLIAPYFNLVVRTAVDKYLPKAIKTRQPIFCVEFVLLSGTKPPLTIWKENSRLTDNTSDPMDVETYVDVYSGDVIEIRAVQYYQPECMSCQINRATRVLDPCGHFGMCMDCCTKWENECYESKKLFTCPICRKKINACIDTQAAAENKIKLTFCTKMSIDSSINWRQY